MIRELFVLALTGFCLAQAVSETHTADVEFLHKQKKIYELFFYLDQPKIVGSEAYEVGYSYDIESNLELYTNKVYVQEFMYRFKYGMLRRGALFSVYYKEHRDEVLSLFRLFYGAKDFQTFYKTAAWARYYMNEGMFVTAFTAAVMYRPDCKYIQLPPYYEVYPYFFFNSEVIQEAQRIKMLSGYKKGVSLENVETFLVNTNYTYYCQKPVFEQEYKLDYFTEDIGLNNYYYYFRTVYPFWMGLKDLQIVPKHIRGEFYYYIHQQLMSRYYLERLSNGLGEIEDFDFAKPFLPSYYSNLVYANGVSLPNRDFWSMVPYYKYKYVKEAENIEFRILNAIDSGYVYDLEGKQYGIYTPEGLNLLGNIIEGNADSPNVRFYGAVDALYRDIFGFNYDCKNKNCYVPSALQSYSTSMRDPAFYRMYKRIINYFLRYKNYLTPYTLGELEYTGVKIENVFVDKIYTFFEKYDALINNAVTVENWKDANSFNIKASQYRLNYKPFTYRFDIKSDRNTKGVVRIFLGPSFDYYDNEYSYFKNNWMNFYELDKFTVILKPGLNNIERSSTESAYTMGDVPSGDYYYRKILKAIEGSEPFTYTDRLFGFPDRLLFPRGTPAGMKYKLFFYISPVDETKLTTYEFPMFGKILYDGKPMGFPLDRPLYSWYLDLPNLYFKDINIYYLKGEEGYYKAKNFENNEEQYQGKYQGPSSQYPGQQYGQYEKYGKYEKPIYTGHQGTFNI